MTTPSYAIPKPLWDAVENVLMTKSRELIKDLAATLHQSEKPLLEAFKATKHSFYLIDTSDPTEERYECETLICEHGVAHRCRKPVLFGRQVCPAHEFTPQPSSHGKPLLRRLMTEEGETYFVDTLLNVYTVDFERVGFLTENVLTLYEVEDCA